MAWQAAERNWEDEFLARSTLPVLFERSASRRADRVAQRYKGGVYDRSLAPAVVDPAPPGGYADLTYDDLRGIVRRLAGGFRDLGLEPGDRVALFCGTRMEWAQTDLAVLTAGGVVTTVYTASTADQVRYLVDDPGASVVVAENQALLSTLFEVEDDLDLDFVVSVDDPGGFGERADVHTLAEVHRRGAKRFTPDRLKAWLGSRDLDDLASLVYTSGTTGEPKGVELTHGNVRSMVNQIRRRLGPRPDKTDVPVVDEETTSLSVLPLAHVFERVGGHFYQLASGSTVAYAESPDTLAEDFDLVQPNLVIGVPRVYERLFDAMREEAQGSALKERVFSWAVDVAGEYADAEQPSRWLQAKHRVADELVYGDVRAAVGGDLELFVSGGGTLSADLCGIFHGMGLPIYEGYGLTETSTAVSLNPPEEPKLGTVGPPLARTEVTVDKSVVPEMEFGDAMGDTGELLVAGANVVDGYWNKPGETDASFTEVDGTRWFRTGDIVTLRRDGYVTFHERAKQLVVLSTGKNLAPAPIEDAFADSEVVEQAMVVGDERKFVGALVVPNVEGLQAWAAREGVSLPADRAELAADDRVRERVAAEVDRVNEGFQPHERVGDFRLVETAFTQESGLLTPTMKKKRHRIRERFADAVDDIYDDPVGDDERAAEGAADDADATSDDADATSDDADATADVDAGTDDTAAGAELDAHDTAADGELEAHGSAADGELDAHDTAADGEPDAAEPDDQPADDDPTDDREDAAGDADGATAAGEPDAPAGD
jgi:long-chain acyl-CoA synthetase